MKYAALAYFESGTRDAEVSVAWPAEAIGPSLLYKLRFLGGSNEVAVQALGAMPEPLRCDLRRTPGFPRNAKTSKTVAWLEDRYPAIHPKGRTAADLIADAQRLIDTQAGDPSWFRVNYRMAVLGPKAAYRRLADTHHMPAERRGGLKQNTHGTGSPMRTI